jgi:glutathione peroxidase
MDSIQINSLTGKPIHWDQFKGKWVLIVNTASKCGLTPQFEQLEEVYRKYKDNLVIIGCPSNDFAQQEPGNASEIQEFCQINYGVSFIMTEKIHVKGDKKHPLYQWLTSKSKNGKSSSRVWWNFQKYLINPKGEFVDYFLPITKPNSKKITKYFQKV